jgi:hypothetical protein
VRHRERKVVGHSREPRNFLCHEIKGNASSWYAHGDVGAEAPHLNVVATTKKEWLRRSPAGSGVVDEGTNGGRREREIRIGKGH